MNLFRDAEAPSTRKLLLGAGHLAALWALAFAQPLFDLLGKNPDFFVARENSPGDIILLGFGFILIPPLVMLAAEWGASKIGPRAYLGLHLTLFTILAGFLFVQLVDPVLGSIWPLVMLIALGLGFLLAVASIRVKFVNNLFDILVVAPIAILAIFLFASDSSKVVFPDEATASIGASVGRDVPVVMVTFDELGTVNLLGPDEQIDPERFPNFARMAGTSTWYPNFTTTSFFTPTAMPGILTGNRPPDGALPTASEQPENLFSLLADRYRFHVLEPITQICSEQLCPAPEGEQVAQRVRLRSLASDLRYVVGRLVLPEQLGETLPDVGTNFEDFGGGAEGDAPAKDELFVKGREGRSTPDEYADFIREIPTTDRALTMMHVKQPHQPWKYGVLGEQYNPDPINQLSESTGTWLTDRYGVESAQQRMMVQTGFADTLLGQVIDRLEKTGLWDRAMVIVTADHGISFEGGSIPQRQADERAMGEVANPPLLIKYPGEREGKTDPRHVMTLDLVPTIARELEVTGGYETEGFPIQGELPKRDVTVENISFEEFTVSMPKLIAQRKVALERQRQRFGDGPLYTLGPAPELIGSEAPPPGGRQQARLERVTSWDDYAPNRAIVPMYATGTLRGIDPGTGIAVAVNGRVRGTARAFPFEGKTRFGTVFDPAALRNGRNVVSIYRIDGSNLVYLGGNRGATGQ